MEQANKPIIINVVSGKGGTGKSLFVAVLAEALAKKHSVLMIDMDFFVRGLSALYANQISYHQSRVNVLLSSSFDSVSDFVFKCNQVEKRLNFINDPPGILTQSDHTKLIQNQDTPIPNYDLWPAVREIDQTFELTSVMPKDVQSANDVMAQILQAAKNSQKQYQFILLDSRAGFDSLISAAHNHSTFSICIDEHDEIAKITSDMVIKQLDASSPIADVTGKLAISTKIFRIRNKCRDYSMDVSSSFNTSSGGGKFVGDIPFCAEIMDCFDQGKQVFDSTLNRSVYKYALVQCWNNIVKSLQLLPEFNLSFAGKPQGIEEPLLMLSPDKRYRYFAGLFCTFVSLLSILLFTPFSQLVSLFSVIPRSIGLVFLCIGLSIVISVPLNHKVLKHRKDKKTKNKQRIG